MDHVRESTLTENHIMWESCVHHRQGTAGGPAEERCAARPPQVLPAEEGTSAGTALPWLLAASVQNWMPDAKARRLAHLLHVTPTCQRHSCM